MSTKPDENHPPHVEPQNPKLESSPISEKVAEERPFCKWNGVEYSAGAYICVAEGNKNVLYLCNQGVEWVRWGDC